MDRDGEAPFYTFRDNDLAATRLALVADTFAPPTTAFLGDAVTGRPAVAIDVGCGLGHCTRLISAVTTAERTIGLDQSEAFLTRARESATDRVEFIVHDVTRLPLPEAPADLLFCRFLLVHHPEPEHLLRRWFTQLKPGGVLLAQEPEAIESHHPTINRYLEVLEGLLASRGMSLYVGPRLVTAGASEDTEQLINRTTMMPVPISRAASMFAMNLLAWGDDPYIQDRYSPADVAKLERELRALIEQDGTDLVHWTFREIAFRRSND